MLMIRLPESYQVDCPFSFQYAQAESAVLDYDFVIKVCITHIHTQSEAQGLQITA